MCDLLKTADNEDGAAAAAAAMTGPFSMTDEERDIGAFQYYVRALSPDALWDVRAHLDAERYPRRSEAITREMTRRGLFFVSPYTPGELRIRALLVVCVAVAALALLLRFLPAGLSAAQAWLGARFGVSTVEVAPGQRLPFLTGLAACGTEIALVAFPVFRAAAILAAVFLPLLLGRCLLLFRRRRLRRDIVFMAGIATALVWGLLLGATLP